PSTWRSMRITPPDPAARAERTPSARRAAAAGGRPPAPPITPERLRALWPDIWALIRPRRGLFLLGLVLMAINRVAGLVLPASTKFVIDDVIGKRHVSMLAPIVLAVVGATLVQGITSYGLTQLLSKAAQRLIAELRRNVQAHIGRLPVAYYDANKTGTLVSRIMSDVEGIRNLIGTGLVEFAGGILTATIAFIVLLGIVGAVVMFVGTRQILAGSMTLGGFFTYTAFLGFMVAPIFQIVAVGTQITEALAGLERTREVLRERPEDADPRRTITLERL